MSELTNQSPTTSSKRLRSPRSQLESSPKKSKRQTATLLRPASDDSEGWKKYWEAQGQPWRKEPEIDEERQKYLIERRAIKDSVPLKGTKLARADVEWLLDTHEGGLGPVDWKDGNQRERRGVNLCLTNLQAVDCSGLPLARVDLTGALLQEANLSETHLEGALLARTQLRGANLSRTNLEKAFLNGAQLEKANLKFAQLEGIFAVEVEMNKANLAAVKMRDSVLIGAQLKGANLSEAQLEGTSFMNAELEDASFYRAQLERTNWSQANLRGVDLREATLDVRTILADTALDARIRIADVIWNGASLTRINWDEVPRLGDEDQSRKPRDGYRRKKTYERVWEYEAAVRAYLQVSIVLRGQGLTEVADRFAYRAQLLRRVVFRLQRHWLKYLFSWFLALLTGYGYRMWRIVVAYILLILIFALAYWSLGVQSFGAAVIVSVTAFHGRVFTNPFRPNILDVQVIVIAIEAVCGLVIEGLFVAMLVQRFFNR